MTWGIYLIINKVNGKMYVGISKNLGKRWKDHKWNLLNDMGKPNQHLQNAVNKYGIENFEFFVIVEHYEDYKKLGDLEQYFIAKWQLDNPKYGYNKTKGGEGGSPNNETRQKQSQTMKALWSDPNSAFNSKELRQKRSEAVQGNKNPFYGKHHTQKTRQKISQTKIKKMARVTKDGIRNNRQVFALRWQGKKIKNSIDF